MHIAGELLVEAWKYIPGGYKEFSIYRNKADGSLYGVMLYRKMHNMKPPTYQAVGVNGTLKAILKDFRAADADLSFEIEHNFKSERMK